MEVLLIIAVFALVVWWLFFRNQESEKPTPVETTTVNTKSGDVVETAPSWHTAPPEDVKPVTVDDVAATLDVNHDGKVNLEDVKEVVKKVRKPRTPKAEKPAAKKAAPKKAAAITAKKPGRKPKAK